MLKRNLVKQWEEVCPDMLLHRNHRISLLRCSKYSARLRKSLSTTSAKGYRYVCTGKQSLTKIKKTKDSQLSISLESSLPESILKVTSCWHTLEQGWLQDHISSLSENEVILEINLWTDWISNAIRLQVIKLQSAWKASTFRSIHR